jgi:hypothetical protein
MSLIITYPRFFTTRSGPGVGVVLSKGDELVSSLYKSWQFDQRDTLDWPLRQAVLETAIRLFGNFDLWVEDQRNNPKLKGANRDYLEDTLSYIAGKDRLIHPLVWLDVMQEVGSIVDAPAPANFRSPTIADTTGTSVTAIQKWCAREGGLEDLFMALHVLFGQAKA